MTVYKVTVATRAELSDVVIICDGCGTEVVIRVESANVPHGCPSCGKEYIEEIKEALAGLARFHRAAQKAENRLSGNVFQFSIKEKVEPDK
jgi:predicted RNA-binding Zn-ribbon protein involved in translation (DUF1610 family)